ncbi:MAG: prolipoprotein diacylglyceryl transferase [Firmicutes bacterium]|nr:prolipoprotein diacylglyceryl transferase [Bacillota bacterium]
MHRHLFNLFGSERLPVNTYGLLVGLGILGALGILWLFCKRTKVPDPVFRFYSTVGIIAIAMGLFGAWFFQFIYQAIYNAVAGRPIQLNAGLTFMGGLVMGITTFVVVTLVFGKPVVKTYFWQIVSIGAISVGLALALGRWGCFFAGCCHGGDGIGIYFPQYVRDRLPDGSFTPWRRVSDVQRLPTNLFEAIYSSILLVVMCVMLLRLKKGQYNVFIYGLGYSIWRFSIEFARDDQRYQVGPLSPSQWQSLILFIVVGVLLFLMIKYDKLPFFKKELLWENAKNKTTLPNESIADTPIKSEEVKEAESDSFYTEEEVENVAKKKVNANEKENNLFKYVFWGALGGVALFAILGFILILASNPTPVTNTRAAAWFMFLLMHISLMVATLFMPLRGGITDGVFAEKSDELDDEDAIEEHFKQGNSIWNKWTNKAVVAKEDV